MSDIISHALGSLVSSQRLDFVLQGWGPGLALTTQLQTGLQPLNVSPVAESQQETPWLLEVTDTDHVQIRLLCQNLETSPAAFSQQEAMAS